MNLGNIGVIEVVIVLILGLILTAILVGSVGVIIWAVRQVGKGSTRGSTQSADTAKALVIAQERYAKGEITREEYQQIMSDIKKT